METLYQSPFAFQVRTSYLPNEILWGHQFDHNVLVYDKKVGSYQILHSRVNKTAMDDTPRLSARQLDMRSKRNSSGLSNSTTTENSPSKKPFKRLPTVAWNFGNLWINNANLTIFMFYNERQILCSTKMASTFRKLIFWIKLWAGGRV